MNCDLDTSANSLMDSLTKDVDIKIPDINLSDPIFKFPGDESGALYKEISSVSNKDIVASAQEGDGTFDVLMEGIAAHLDKQYKLNRISADDYSQVYIALTEAAMTNAIQFVLQKDATKWAAINAQLSAITARVLLETEKAKLVSFHIEALDAKTKYALGKTQLAISGVEHCTAQYTYENILPKQSILAQKQVDGLEIDNRTKTFNLTAILPSQHAGLELDNDAKDYGLRNTLPVNHRTAVFNLTELLPAQRDLLHEQKEVQVAQTLDVRSDGTPVTGTLGKQKELYTQQIDSYKRNAETNAAKMFLDSWITQKTLDEGLTPPDSLKNASVDEVMNAIKLTNNLG